MASHCARYYLEDLQEDVVLVFLKISYTVPHQMVPQTADVAINTTVLIRILQTREGKGVLFKDSYIKQSHVQQDDFLVNHCWNFVCKQRLYVITFTFQD